MKFFDGYLYNNWSYNFENWHLENPSFNLGPENSFEMEFGTLAQRFEACYAVNLGKSRTILINIQ